MATTDGLVKPKYFLSPSFCQSHQGSVWQMQLQLRYFLVVTIFSMSAPVPTVPPHVTFQWLPLYSVVLIKGKIVLSWMNNVLTAHGTLHLILVLNVKGFFLSCKGVFLMYCIYIIGFSWQFWTHVVNLIDYAPIKNSHTPVTVLTAHL